jgi:hypothetical protein
MKIPGFTAEASYSKPSESYHGTSGRTRNAQSARVIPQRLSQGNCIPGCICVTPEGCPCCSAFPWPQPGRAV